MTKFVQASPETITLYASLSKSVDELRTIYNEFEKVTDKKPLSPNSEQKKFSKKEYQKRIKTILGEMIKLTNVSNKEEKSKSVQLIDLYLTSIDKLTVSKNLYEIVRKVSFFQEFSVEQATKQAESQLLLLAEIPLEELKIHSGLISLSYLQALMIRIQNFLKSEEPIGLQDVKKIIQEFSRNIFSRLPLIPQLLFSTNIQGMQVKAENIIVRIARQAKVDAITPSYDAEVTLASNGQDFYLVQGIKTEIKDSSSKSTAEFAGWDSSFRELVWAIDPQIMRALIEKCYPDRPFHRSSTEMFSNQVKQEGPVSQQQSSSAATELYEQAYTRPEAPTAATQFTTAFAANSTAATTATLLMQTLQLEQPRSGKESKQPPSAQPLEIRVNPDREPVSYNPLQGKNNNQRSKSFFESRGHHVIQYSDPAITTPKTGDLLVSPALFGKAALPKKHLTVPSWTGEGTPPIEFQAPKERPFAKHLAENRSKKRDGDKDEDTRSKEMHYKQMKNG